MRGIILAGGTGSRLAPLTGYISKQLLPVYDKPMIYYPLSVLMLSDIRDILIIVSPDSLSLFTACLGDGSAFGINIQYAVQEAPNGIPEAFSIGSDFVGNDSVCLALGDNLFWGQGIINLFSKCSELASGAIVIGQTVSDPERYGVAEFDTSGNVIRIHEKPSRFVSDCAVTGLYFYDNDVIELAADCPIGDRGEKEITWVNNQYIDRKALQIRRLGRGTAWLDTGTHKSLMEASMFVETIETRSGVKIACLEEIAISKGWVSADDVVQSDIFRGSSSYADYLRALVEK